jgi:methionyl aminopeptidase
VKPGVTTGELDRLCHAYMRDVQGTVPAPLNYAPRLPALPWRHLHLGQRRDLPRHSGRPRAQERRRGQLDITVIIKEGYYGDTSRMFVVGEASILAKRLSQITYECMWLGIQQVRNGARLGDIGHAIQSTPRRRLQRGARILRPRHRQGLPRRPAGPALRPPGTGMELKTGMIFTVEPMINAGKRDIRTMPDQWTVKTRDRSLSAQWEHTVLVTETGYEVLTLSEGSPLPPRSLRKPWRPDAASFARAPTTAPFLLAAVPTTSIDPPMDTTPELLLCQRIRDKLKADKQVLFAEFDANNQVNPLVTKLRRAVDAR